MYQIVKVISLNFEAHLGFLLKVLYADFFIKVYDVVLGWINYIEFCGNLLIGENLITHPDYDDQKPNCAKNWEYNWNFGKKALVLLVIYSNVQLAEGSLLEPIQEFLPAGLIFCFFAFHLFI